MSSAERGIKTTVVCCFNAVGMYVPPIIIFKRKRLPPELKDGAPCGSIVTCNETGWMSSGVFLQWLQHFIAWVKPSSSKPILLVLDGHSMHVKNLKAILLARSANVIMLLLPPHTTHKAQPLDKTFFKPLQTYYDQSVEKWLRVNVGRAVTPYQVCRLFNEAYCKAATMTTAINGFSSCGIWPCSRDVFCESEFQPSFSNFNQPPVSTLPPQQPAPATTQSAPASTQPAPASTLPAPATTPPQQPASATTPSQQPAPATTQPQQPAPATAATAPPNQMREVYRTNPDGKCFLRSVAISLNRKLQVNRDSYGT